MYIRGCRNKMSIAQKVIKYLAMAFAIALIVGIITTIVRVVSSIPLTLKINTNEEIEKSEVNFIEQ